MPGKYRIVSDDLKYFNSAGNDKVAAVREIARNRHPDDGDYFFIEGERAVSEVADFKGKILRLVMTASFFEDAKRDPVRLERLNRIYLSAAETFTVSDKVFSSLSQTVTPQGICAVVKKPFDSIFSGGGIGALGRILVLENLQDPGNVGTCIRTADAFGFDAVILVGNCASVYNQKVLRSTVGSLFHIPAEKYKGDIKGLAELLKAHGFTIAAAHPRGGVSSRELRDLTASRANGEKPKAAAVVGNEAGGLTKAAIETCDVLVTIPMPGRAESLNAGIAAAVIMYELSAQ